MDQPRQNKMGVEPIGRLLASMSWPAIVSMMLNALYNVVDSIFVSMVSKEALTAVSLVMPVQLLMISVGVGSAIGVNSLIARRLGAKKNDEADMAASTSIRIGVFNGLIFAFIGIFLAVPFMKAYTKDPVIYASGLIYLRITTIFSIFNMFEFQLTKVLQATGNMIAPMIISLSGITTNIILDPIMIFGLIGFPALGIAGAAIATIIGQVVGSSLAIYIILKKEHLVHIRIRGFRINWLIVKDIYAVGLPSIFMQSINSVMLLGYNAIISASSSAVAVLGIYQKLHSFIFMPVFGLNQGSMPIMGYNYGAKNKARLMKTYRYTLFAAFCVMILGTLAFQLFPDIMLKFFNADREMLEIGVPALRLVSICFIPAAFGVITSTLFQGTGHGMYSLIGSLIRELIGILPLAYILYHTFGIKASWASFSLAEILGVTYLAVMLKILYKKEIRYLN